VKNGRELWPGGILVALLASPPKKTGAANAASTLSFPGWSSRRLFFTPASLHPGLYSPR
jgi:hypothetical protein